MQQQYVFVKPTGTMCVLVASGEQPKTKLECEHACQTQKVRNAHDGGNDKRYFIENKKLSTYIHFHLLICDSNPHMFSIQFEG